MDQYVADYLFGNGGDDRLVAYGKNSVLSGGSGNDVLVVQYGETESGTPNQEEMHLFGGPGHDLLYGGSSGDLLDGGPGDDIIRAYGGADKAFGREGDDLIYGYG